MRLLAVLVLLAACGRVGFDDLRGGGGGDDTVNDAAVPRDVYVAPTCSTGCAAADFCGTATGACNGPASCRPDPLLPCAQEIQFVCGCDGTTYVNACEAEALGISIDHQGACGYVPNCTPQCGPGDYCYTPLGMCGQPGTCMPIPAPGAMCPDVPVCGCDDMNYSNSCAAAEAGMSLFDNALCPVF